MGTSEILDELSKVVINGDVSSSKKAAEKALAAGIDPIEAINGGLSKGMEVVGKKFEDFEIFLPGVMLAADAMKAALSVLRPKIIEGNEKEVKQGKVVIGTSTGDIHDIGKNLVATMLAVAGFEVHDLGSDVKVLDFIKKANEVNADIIAMSSLMFVSTPYQMDVVRSLEDKGVRDKYFVIIGGGATSPEWTEEIKADGWGRSVLDGVDLCKRFIAENMPRPLKKPLYVGVGD